MKPFLRALAALAGIGLFANPAHAERLVSALSNETIEVGSDFSGETLSLFGTIEADRSAASAQPAGPYQVIIVVTGPLSDRVARFKTNVFGIWLNTEQVEFEKFPTYFQVLSSSKLASITNAVTLNEQAILPEAQAKQSAKSGWWNSTVFAYELVRLMTERGFFSVRENGVRFLSTTAYTAKLGLPHDIPNGPYIARTFVFKNGKIVAQNGQGFVVRKVGIERFLGSASREFPLAYGIVCVVLALATGWLAGVLFKR
jgi:uncharacterized protein (TIGR02186 family)